MPDYAIMSAGKCSICPTPTRQIVSMKSLTRFCLMCGTVHNTKTGEVVEPPAKRRITILGEMAKSRSIPSKLVNFMVGMAIQLDTKPEWEQVSDIDTIASEIDNHTELLFEALKNKDRAKIMEHATECANGYMKITNLYQLLG